MSYAYPQHHQHHDYPDQYPPVHDPYANDPYAQTYAHQPPSAYPYQGDAHGDYSQSDFVSPDRDGDGIPGGRNLHQSTYPPPQASDVSLADKYAAGAYEHEAASSTWEKPVPVTRGSIAAQLAAEGSIPKKEGLRMFRKDEHAGALTRGGRARCCGRVFCCTLILAILILVGIVAAFFLWVKPPDVGFDGIEGPETGSEVTVATDGFDLNVRLKINVVNPNFFGADFSKIEASAFYPTKPSDKVGGGEMNDVSIKKYSNNTLHFPFAINYTTSYDSDLSVLTDIATRCGFLGSNKRQLTVNYKVKVHVKIIAISIAPSFSSSTSFDCPLSESDISGFLGGSLSSLLGGGSSRRRRDSVLALDDDEATLDPAAVHLATRHALAKLNARGAEELVGQLQAAGRRYRIGTTLARPAAGFE
ncbi:uncharacterized protein RHOBADRAFT_52959 [Rhodotorula graminis WP1]|uniref:Late embryogenesis abundant protein LEA-2 subgroup domain-containing protein n=1 Tax=Rhodotorula graminis (strain WP1) TaxID=578459 RepID=A0A194S979_RHOGW|nr:uncharacterized protein RHOBADRAFT_52959 [Rhodotorula graminis WP1]KPV75951.1 hypothetical protein RHOBADRAFT_52959 [Rhodotorula graminis WP1]